MNTNIYQERKHLYLVCYPQIKDRCKILIISNVNSSQWSKKYQKVKATHHNADAINEMIQELRVYVERVYIECMRDGVHLDSKVLKSKIKGRLKGVVTSEFYEYADIWLTRQKNTLANNTYRSRSSVINKLRDDYPDIKWSSINPTFIIKIKSELLAKKGPNTVNKYLRIFKQIIGDAYMEGIHQNNIHQLKSFVNKAKESDSVYLTSDEIKSLYRHLHDMDDKLRNASILFLRQCLTGLRYGSLTSLSTALRYDVDGKEMLSLTTNKTGASVTIPVSPMLSRLMEIDAHVISNQKLNEYIKDACKSAGIDKYNKISSHTARRTFASNMVLAGMPTNVIMSITGHKTESVFWKYVKLAPSQRSVQGADILIKLFG
jgi:integrase